MDIIQLAEENQQITKKILETTGLITAWESIGAKVYLVGSLKTGLLMKNRDIDLHIYTDQVHVSESFHVMQHLAEKLSLQEISYRNLIHTEEECIEWHTVYQDPQGHSCKFDMIHIRRGSKYDGVVEKVTDAILHQLTPEIRKIILGIKYEIPDTLLIPGIEIYQAVFTGKVQNYKEFLQWRQNHPLVNSLEWQP